MNLQNFVVCMKLKLVNGNLIKSVFYLLLQAVPTPYDFGYDIAGDYGEFKQNRKESSDGKGNVQGSYGYTDAHGIYRQVDYVADAYGFRANVKTNEPGTDNQNPADVHIQANPVQYAPAPHYGGYPRY
ncbi:UNVERIFIED_CONTAM: Cuticle protein 10.9 [Trichonephila clavipes]